MKRCFLREQMITLICLHFKNIPFFAADDHCVCGRAALTCHIAIHRDTSLPVFALLPVRYCGLAQSGFEGSAKS